jgi:hypothetical protein
MLCGSRGQGCSSQQIDILDFVPYQGRRKNGKGKYHLSRSRYAIPAFLSIVGYKEELTSERTLVFASSFFCLPTPRELNSKAEAFVLRISSDDQ